MPRLWLFEHSMHMRPDDCCISCDTTLRSSVHLEPWQAFASEARAAHVDLVALDRRRLPVR